MNGKFRDLGLVGLVGLASGCSAMLSGASHYAKTRDAFILTQTAAEIAKVYEEDERAKETASRGLERVAKSIERSNAQHSVPNTNVTSTLRRNPSDSNELSGNPLFWDLSDSDTNSEWVAFSKNLGESNSHKCNKSISMYPLMPTKGAKYAVRSFPTQEIFIMRKNEPNSLKRITWDNYGDFLPKFVDNGIMWIKWNHCSWPNVLHVYHFDMSTDKESLVIKLSASHYGNAYNGYLDAYKGIKDEINRDGYKKYLHLIK